MTGKFLKAEIVGNDFSPASCGALLWSLETAQAGSQSRSAPHIVCLCVCGKNVNVLGFNKKYDFSEPKNPEQSILSSD